MKIAVRMDDITPDMDWKSFLKFEKLLDKYGIAPLIGVVPCNRDTNLMREASRVEFWDYVHKLTQKGWCVAQHGCYHQYTTKKAGIFPLNPFSEFAGLEKEKQRKLIRDGKEMLKHHGIETDIFMAPGHSFDENTLEVLKESGFRYLTDGFGDAPYERSGLTFLPISVKRSDCFREKEGFTTLVFHTNGMSEEEIEGYDKMFAAHRDQFISYREYLKQTPVKRGWIGQKKEWSLATAKRVTVRLIALVRSKRAQ